MGTVGGSEQHAQVSFRHEGGRGVPERPDELVLERGCRDRGVKTRHNVLCAYERGRLSTHQSGVCDLTQGTPDAPVRGPRVCGEVLGGLQ